MLEFAIEAKNVSKVFTLKNESKKFQLGGKLQKNKLLAVDNVSFEVPRGKIYGLIGLNGSGKTTLLRMVGGIYKPDAGSVTVRGEASLILHTGVGFNDEFNAKENIITFGMISGMKKNEIEDKVNSIIKFAGLQKFEKQKLKYYSSGMKARLACSTALEINPDILILDEILAAGDLAFSEKSYNAFLSFKNRGRTILFASHNLKTIQQLSDKVLLLQRGKLIMEGEPSEVIAKYQQIVRALSQNLQN